MIGVTAGSRQARTWTQVVLVKGGKRIKPWWPEDTGVKGKSEEKNLDLLHGEKQQKKYGTWIIDVTTVGWSGRPWEPTRDQTEQNRICDNLFISIPPFTLSVYPMVIKNNCSYWMMEFAGQALQSPMSPALGWPLQVLAVSILFSLNAESAAQLSDELQPTSKVPMPQPKHLGQTLRNVWWALNYQRWTTLLWYSYLAPERSILVLKEGIRELPQGAPNSVSADLSAPCSSCRRLCSACWVLALQLGSGPLHHSGLQTGVSVHAKTIYGAHGISIFKVITYHFQLVSSFPKVICLGTSLANPFPRPLYNLLPPSP